MSITTPVLPGYPAWLKALFPPLGHDVDVPVVTEPALSGDELVAVRQLIEDRFGDQTAPNPVTALASAGGYLIDAVCGPFYGVFHQLLQDMGFKPAPEKVAPQTD